MDMNFLTFDLVKAYNIYHKFIIILGNGICPRHATSISNPCNCASEMDKIDTTIKSKQSHYERRQPLKIDYFYENENTETDYGLKFDYIKIRSKNGRDMICPSTQYSDVDKIRGHSYGLNVTNSLNETLYLFKNGFYCNGPY